jgi:fatty-acyl-CoA synthase
MSETTTKNPGSAPTGTRLAPLAERRAALEERHPTWVPTTLHGALDGATARWPDRPYVITDEVTYTYADIQAWSLRIARGLVSRGIRPGDHVGIEMANYPEFVACKYAISRAGATAVPINFLNRRDELAYVLEQSRAVALIVMARHRDLDYLAMLDDIAPGWAVSGGGETLPDLRTVVVMENAGPVDRPDVLTLGRVEAEAPADLDLPDSDPSSMADILYTSGTTGGPKGVQLTHDMLLRTAYGAAYGRGFEDGRRVHFAMPMYHVFGYVEGMLPVTFVGGAIIPHVVFNPAASLVAIERHRATDMLAIPLMTRAVMDALRDQPADISSLASILSSGTASPPEIWDRIDAELACDEVTTGYGMSETTASSTVTRPDDGPDRRRTTNGRLRDVGVAGDRSLDGRLVVYRAVDTVTGEDLGRGVVGELQAFGPGVTSGYWDKPDATAAAFTDDGWLRTGDLGQIDEDDYLHLVGRVKDCYRCGGEQVVPSDIEDVLVRHPAVAQALVVPVPDDRMGEVGVAFIVRRDGVDVTAEELTTVVADQLARFKVPKHVLFVDAAEIPLTASGRPRKFLLSEMAVARLRETGTSAP